MPILSQFIKKDKSNKSNYRPGSVLSNYSKVYEKLIYNQLYQHFENILFPSQCGFPKGYITFYAPICNSCPNL